MLEIIKKTKNCGVICETNGKVFPTISQAAKYAGCNDWTMSVKMTAKGQFVDSLGRVYKRLRPMDTKNTYTSCSDKMVKPITRKKAKTKQKNLPSINGSAEKIQPVKAEKEQRFELSKKVPDIVREAIEEKMISLLKEHGIYEQFMELIKATGYKPIKG